MDIGCGDGRVLIQTALKTQAKGIGIEKNKELVEKAKANVQAAGLTDKINILHCDIFDPSQSLIFATLLRQMSVVFIFLLPRTNCPLSNILLSNLAIGSRLISSTFQLTGMQPDCSHQVEPFIKLWSYVTKMSPTIQPSSFFPSLSPAS